MAKDNLMVNKLTRATRIERALQFLLDVGDISETEAEVLLFDAHQFWVSSNMRKKNHDPLFEGWNGNRILIDPDSKTWLEKRAILEREAASEETSNG